MDGMGTGDVNLLRCVRALFNVHYNVRDRTLVVIARRPVLLHSVLFLQDRGAMNYKLWDCCTVYARADLTTLLGLL